MDLSISATRPQAEFHQLTCKYPCFVAGFGSGKTYCMINQAILDCFASPHALIYLHAPNYTLVRDVIWARLQERLVELGIKYKANKTEMEIDPQHPQMGKFRLRSLDDPAKLVGYEAYRTHVDELDTLNVDKAQGIWRQLMARTRQKLPDVPVEQQNNRVCAYSTPEGYEFIYQTWLEGSTNIKQSVTDVETGNHFWTVKQHKLKKNYQAVTAATYTNTELQEGYADSLYESYPAELVEAYLWGKPTNLTQGSVYRSYDRHINDSKEKVEGNEPLFVGMDFNRDKMAATVFVKRDSGWHAVDEFSGLESTPSMCKAIRDRYPANPIHVYPDRSGQNRTTVTEASKSDLSVIESEPFYFTIREMPNHRKKNFNIKDRVMAANKAFEDKKVFINYIRCPNTANALEKQAYGSDHKPDKDSPYDHQNDATTYFIVIEMPIARPVANVNFSFAV
jgi:phage terminase large subunit